MALPNVEPIWPRVACGTSVEVPEILPVAR